VKCTIGTGAYEVARTRFNRYGPLRRLGKLDEARTVLEGCLEVFRRVGDAKWEAMAFGALADVWNALGDPYQALALARQGLGLHERLPDPGDRAIAHHNLGVYLYATDSPDDARSHQLAALVYRLITGLDARSSLHNLAIDIREAASHGARFDLPRLAALLDDPAFAPLRTFLTDRAVDLPALQTRIDQLVEQARATS
jgi:tetratricopeptide (TPR) repeat protein